MTGSSVIGSIKKCSDQLNEDNNISDAITGSSVTGIKNIRSLHSRTSSVVHDNSVTGLSVSGINNIGFLPEDPRVISQSSQVGLVDLNTGDDDEDYVASNDSNVPDLGPNPHNNDEDEDCDDDSISSNESNIELLTNDVSDNIPSAERRRHF